MKVGNIESQQKYDILNERLRVIEDVNILGRVDTMKLSLVLDLVIPSKFKVLEFEKYMGQNVLRHM